MTDRIAEIRARLEAASPGPWAVKSQELDDWGCVRGANKYPVALARSGGVYDADEHRRNGTDPYDHNAQFIAAARQDIPYLLDQIDAKDAEIERLRTDVNAHKSLLTEAADAFLAVRNEVRKRFGS